MTRRPITEDDLHGYVDHALTAERREEVAAYLARHRDVATRIADYGKQGAALRDYLEPVADEPVPARLNVARLVASNGRPRYGWRDMAAAVALFAVGLAAGWSLHPPGPAGDRGISVLAHEAAANYAVYATDQDRPVEIPGSAGPELARWLSQRMNRSVRIPDLSASGYHLMGGRLVATARGPAVMLMYDDKAGTRLVMFTRSMARDGNSKMREATMDKVTGFTWSAKGIGYSLVGPLKADALHPIADEAQRQLDQSV